MRFVNRGGFGPDDFTATLSQGERTVIGTTAHRKLETPIDLWPPGRTNEGYTQGRTDWRFPSASFDPTQPVTLRITGPDGYDHSYTFNLQDLR